MAFRLKIVGWVLVGLYGCGATIAPVMDHGPQERAEAALLAANAAWLDRKEEARSREAVEQYTLAVEGGLPAQVQLARAHYFLAGCHLRFQRESRGEFLRQLERAVSVARRAVMNDPDGMGAYWLAEARWVWARAQGPATFLMVEDELQDLARRSLEMHGDFDGNGSDRMLGALLAHTPAFAGGDLEASERFFAAARAGSPNDLRNEVRMAAEYAVATGDRELFVELLEHVMTTDSQEVSPEGVCARRQAAQLIRKVTKFFPE